MAVQAAGPEVVQAVVQAAVQVVGPEVVQAVGPVAVRVVAVQVQHHPGHRLAGRRVREPHMASSPVAISSRGRTKRLSK